MTVDYNYVYEVWKNKIETLKKLMLFFQALDAQRRQTIQLKWFL